MEIKIVYCTLWNYEPKASSLEEEIKKVYKDVFVTLVEGSGGVFEVSLEDELIFSKKQLNRFPDDGEILEILKEKVKFLMI